MNHGKEVPIPGPIGRIRSAPRRFREWWAAGDPVPKTHVKDMYLTAFLLIFGFASLYFGLNAFLGIKYDDLFTTPGVLLFVAAITLIPGLYAAWVTVCCWRRVPGYDWWILPHFE